MKNQQTSVHAKAICPVHKEMIKPKNGSSNETKFGNFFGDVEFPKYEPDDDALAELAQLMKDDFEKHDDENQRDEARFIPLAFAFFGQFIDHDITLEPVSRFPQRLDADDVTNFRTPALDLDSVYGPNPDVARHLYDTYGSNQAPKPEEGPDASHHTLPYRLLTEDEPKSFDVQRTRQGTAIIGDPRNDENIFISQLHRKMINFHNEVTKYLEVKEPGLKKNHRQLYEKARQIVTLHYHWIIKHEFLPLIIGEEMTGEVLKKRLFYLSEGNSNKPFIPIEFAAAAYRFGHTLIRDTYNLNDLKTERSLFELPFFGLVPPDHFAIGIPKSFNLDWTYFIAYPGKYECNDHLQFCRKVDSKVTSPLFELPFINKDQDPPVSLPERNMQRGRTLGLPSGKEIAKVIKVKDSKVNLYENKDFDIDISGLYDELPLWFYILREAEKETDGKHLGRVGGRIVGETLAGIIEATQKELYQKESDGTDDREVSELEVLLMTEQELKDWRPSLGKYDGKFFLKDLIDFKA